MTTTSQTDNTRRGNDETTFVGIDVAKNELAVHALPISQQLTVPSSQQGIKDPVNRSKEIQPKQIGDYEVIDELGHGGMGVVYKARQKLLNQTVAIKVLQQSLLNEPLAVARFRREMQLIGGLDHPNIVRALNAGETDGTQYFVMEFVDGIPCSDLRVRCLKSGVSFDSPSRIPLPVVCEIVRQVALGLQYAHEFGLVHRDIKPANLMLDRRGTVKILDLGLGKFISEQRPSEESLLLTTLGATMGTIDYISPEQCENAGNVDIRADIYSLGCTFHYLATGQVPYSDSRYDSTRKKLMAHIVGEIPSLTASVPEASGELECIFNKMLAKDPNDRFQTPLELAEALEPFADFDALLKVVDSLQDAKNSAKSSNRIGVRAASRSRPLPKSARNWTAMLLFPVILISVALALPVIQWFRTAQTVAVAEAIVEVQLDLAQLPGLNGGWWFDEIPWFLPSVRELIQHKLAETSDPKTVLGDDLEKYFNPNVAAVYAWLWNIVSHYANDLTPPQRKLVDKWKRLADSGLGNNELEQAIVDSLALLVAAHPATNDWSAVDQHSRAVLEHRLALLKNDRELAMTATESYRVAADLYRREIETITETSSRDNLRRLKTLCLADAARLVYLASGDYEKANTAFEVAYARRDSGEQLSLLLNVEMRGTQGALRAESGNYDDSRFIRALDTLRRSKIGERSHPLAAYIHERYAWSLIDQWKVKEAAEQFNQALLIRATNRKESQNSLASIYVFHNQHGLAMTYRYRGDTNRAVDECQTTLAAIEKEREKASNLGRQHQASLRERAANTRECLADCTLYGGAASDVGRGQLIEAARLYAEAAERCDDGPKSVMQIKQAIVLFLLDDIEKGEAILAGLDGEKRDLLGNQKCTEIIRQLADAVLAFQKSRRQDKWDEGKQALRLFLRRMDVTDPIEGIRRENLEMRLFAAEFLLHSELINNKFAEADRDFAFLDAPFAVFWNKPETKPFIRRIVELTVHLSALSYEKDQDQKHLDRIVRTLQRMRGRSDANQHDELPTLVVFFLTEAASDGFAVFFPQDGRPGELYRVSLTRQQVKRTSKKIDLDDRLCQAIEDEKTTGQKIVTLWSDTATWVRPEDALSDADWPFSKPLP